MKNVMKNESEDSTAIQIAKGIGGGLGFFLGLLFKLGLLWVGLVILNGFGLIDFLTTGV